MGELQVFQGTKVCVESSHESRNGLDDQEKGGVEPGEGKSWGRHVAVGRGSECGGRGYCDKGRRYGEGNSLSFGDVSCFHLNN